MAGIQVVLAQYILSLNSLLPFNSGHSYLLSVLANVLSCCSKYLHSLCVTRPFPCPFSSLNTSWYWIVCLWLWSAVTLKYCLKAAAPPPGKHSSSLMQRWTPWRGVARRETLREPGVRAEHLGLGWNCAPQSWPVGNMVQYELPMSYCNAWREGGTCNLDSPLNKRINLILDDFSD